jgi:hypothetical protein
VTPSKGRDAYGAEDGPEHLDKTTPEHSPPS